MANKIVKDSLLPIFVKQVQVAAAGTAEGSVPKVNDFVAVGAVKGLVGDTPRKGEDGAFYSTVDTAAHIMLESVSGVWTDKSPVYRTSGGSITGTASGNTLIGYAERPKPNTAAGILHVQLVPSAS